MVNFVDKNRRKGRYTLSTAEKYGLDPEGGPYVTVCNKHGTIANYKTRKDAERHLPLGDWCEDCMAE